MKKCKQITELISLRQEQKLAFKQQCEIRFHLLFCPYCRAFEKNSQQIRCLMEKFKQQKDI